MNSTSTNCDIPKDRGVCIVILQRGWVAVGHCRTTPEELTLTNAAIIRVWGTTKGLGELALKGPLNNTILDECGCIYTHPLTVIAVMDCCQEKWNDRN